MCVFLCICVRRKAGYETIMMNCNPETVSTDYDTSSRLYFEPITVEDVLNVIDVVSDACVCVHVYETRAPEHKLRAPACKSSTSSRLHVVCHVCLVCVCVHRSAQTVSSFSSVVRHPSRSPPHWTHT